MQGLWLKLLLVGLCLFAAPVAAQTPLDYVRAGDYDGARAVLARDVKGQPDAPLHLAFLEAVILEQKGDIAGAIRLYRQILALAPNFAPARRNLSIALARVGKRQAAINEAERLSASTDNARLRAEMQQRLAALRAQKSGGVTLRFALQPSSNANRATGETTVTIDGVPFELNPASRQTSAMGVNLGATLWHRWTLAEDWLAVGQLSYDLWQYDKSIVPAQSQVNARLDVSRSFERLVVNFGPRLQRMWLDGKPYRDQTGIGAVASYPLSDRSSVGLGLTYRRQLYPNAGYLTGHFSEITPSLTYLLGRGWAVSGGLSVTRETTRRDYLDHRDLAPHFTLSHRTRAGQRVRFDISYREKRYGGIYPGTGTKRRDDVLTAGVVFSDPRLHFGKLVPEFSLTRVINKSNIAIQRYDSTDFGLSFVKRF